MTAFGLRYILSSEGGAAQRAAAQPGVSSYGLGTVGSQDPGEEYAGTSEHSFHQRLAHRSEVEGSQGPKYDRYECLDYVQAQAQRPGGDY